MAADPRFLSLWSEDERVPYPRDAWLEGGVPASLLPDGDEIPIDVSVVFTAFLQGDFELYDVIKLRSPEGEDLPVIVLGAVSTNTNLLYVMDPRDASILQLDLDEADLQFVNTDYRSFVEFLYQLALFVEADEGKADRAARAQVLAKTFESIDPPALREDGWWPLVMTQLN